MTLMEMVSAVQKITVLISLTPISSMKTKTALATLVITVLRSSIASKMTRMGTVSEMLAIDIYASLTVKLRSVMGSIMTVMV